MKWSWKLGTVAGIGIFVHWTFLILIGWIVLSDVVRGAQHNQPANRILAEALEGTLYIVAIFACIVLHELGHALTARRYGVRTQDITLLPIGGVARLERMPEDPIQEFWIAVAGPAVNVAIAIGLSGVLLVLGSGVAFFSMPSITIDVFERFDKFLMQLLWVNLFLVGFNAIPAFPMDGGRVLRAVLAHFSGDYVRATQVAASIGQMLAIALGFFGLFATNPFLVFIALFVYLGAQEEAHLVQMRSLMKGLPVRAAMMTRFRALSPDDSLAVATSELLASAQQDFPVVSDGRVVGLLRRGDVISALGDSGGGRVGDVMQTDCGTVADTEMLASTFQRMRDSGCSALPVVHDERLVGLITLENVGELMMINSALGRARSQRAEISDAGSSPTQPL
ncbi:MAG TPA: site-2 protease family protein [Pirellulales bacterium]|jgi:Zn-dependent protease|nr:site-2 protease family protein [Pirellulales bacterium]